MAKAKVPENIKEALKLVRQAGFQVTRETEYKKHSFEVASDVLAAFFETQKRVGLKVKDAINEALEAWIESNRKD